MSLNLKLKYKRISNLFENASKKKNEIVDMLKTSSNCMMSQLWYYCNITSIIPPDTNNVDRYTTKEPVSKFEKYVYNITKHFFDFEDTQEFCLFAAMSTYYDEGCMLKSW